MLGIPTSHSDHEWGQLTASGRPKITLFYLFFACLSPLKSQEHSGRCFHRTEQHCCADLRDDAERFPTEAELKKKKKKTQCVTEVVIQLCWPCRQGHLGASYSSFFLKLCLWQLGGKRRGGLQQGDLFFSLFGVV